MSYVVYQMMGVAPKALEDMREERYKVAVLTMEKGEVIEEQSLILPLTEARLLCASMATDDTLPSLLVRGQNAWYDDQHNAALPGLAQVIARTASRMTTWLSHPRLKYLNIRVDMRGGNFVLTDYYGKEASDDVMTLLKIPKINN
jgi:hypothetical protein